MEFIIGTAQKLLKPFLGTRPDANTYQFFEKSTVPLYMQMFEVMKKNKDSVDAKSVDEGLAKVRQGNYAFLYDKPNLDFAAMQKPCDLTTVGDPFNRIVYSYVLRKNDPHVKELSVHILQLVDRGIIEEQIKIWYKRCSNAIINRPQLMLGNNKYNKIRKFWFDCQRPAGYVKPTIVHMLQNHVFFVFVVGLHIPYSASYQSKHYISKIPSQTGPFTTWDPLA